MDKLNKRSILHSQVFRSKHLEPLARLCLKIGLGPNKVTFLSLISTFFAIYFLFNDHLLFSIFALLHIFLDALDGVIARISKTTTFGVYFDIGTDSLVTVLAIAKVGYFLQDFYPYIISGLFALAVIIYFVSRFKAPIVFVRTVSLLVLIIASYPGFPFTKELLTTGYLIVGVITVFSLAKQLQWFVQNN